MRKDNPAKLGKKNTRKSKINLDDLKDKAISIKDRTKVKTKDKSDDSFNKEYPPKLGKSDGSNPLKKYFDRLKDTPLIKDKRLIMVLALIVLIVAVGVLAVNHPPSSSNQTNNTTTPVVAENHFENELVSFDYPKGWNVTNGTKAPLIVTVAKDENNSFSVMNENLKNTTFAERILLWRQNILQSGDITYESNITVDNSSGYNIEATYKVNKTTFNTRGIAISKNNTVYFVIFIFNKSPLDYKNDMDQVINSFHVKF